MAIALGETVSGGQGDAGGDSFTLTSWTPGSNELVLVTVALRDTAITPTCSGNGLNFVQVAIVDNTQGQNSIALFRAMDASPSTGQITVTVTGNTNPVSAMASRLSGVDTSGTDGSGAVEANATDVGPDPDDDDMQIDITTLTNNAWAFGGGTHRSTTFSVPGDETSISVNQSYGTGGGVTTCSTWYDLRASAGATTLGAANDLDGATDWCCVAASIKPASAAVTMSEAESISVSDAASVIVLAGNELGVLVSDGASVSDSPALAVTTPGLAETSVADSVTVGDSAALQVATLGGIPVMMRHYRNLRES